MRLACLYFVVIRIYHIVSNTFAIVILLKTIYQQLLYFLKVEKNLILGYFVSKQKKKKY